MKPKYTPTWNIVENEIHHRDSFLCYVDLSESPDISVAALGLSALIRAANSDDEKLVALKTLRNEVRGTLRAHEIAIRYDSGNSNWTCLEMALEMADAAIAKAEAKP